MFIKIQSTKIIQPESLKILQIQVQFVLPEKVFIFQKKHHFSF